jgi:hypothetical protein
MEKEKMNPVERIIFLICLAGALVWGVLIISTDDLEKLASLIINWPVAISLSGGGVLLGALLLRLSLKSPNRTKASPLTKVKTKA